MRLRINYFFLVLIIMIALSYGGDQVNYDSRNKQIPAVISGSEQGQNQSPPNEGCFSQSFPNIRLEYVGEIAKNKPIKIQLSCDFKVLQISGYVNQRIVDPEGGEATYPSSLTSVISLENDFNSDGFNDIEYIINHGEGVDYIITTDIFLFEQNSQKFVFSINK